MKAITLWQPWASLIVESKKHIETRSWKTDYRGEILIHAAQKQPPKLSISPTSMKHFINANVVDWDEEYLKHRTFSGDYISRWRKDLVLSAILGHANLTDCILITEEYSEFIEHNTPAEYAFGDFTPGRYAWVMTDPVKFLNPIPAKGMQRIWEYCGDLREGFY